jgi:hypothetical protein
VALRPRLSPGWLWSRCEATLGRCTRAVKQVLETSQTRRRGPNDSLLPLQQPLESRIAPDWCESRFDAESAWRDIRVLPERELEPDPTRIGYLAALSFVVG